LLQQDQTAIMKNKQIEVAAKAADSSPITETMDTNTLLTRREMLGITGMAGLAALTGIAPDALVAQTAQPPVSSATGAFRLHMQTGSVTS
jgi:hypothetical protein